ncbi:MAG: DUF4373 domain-containing protein [Eubacteriales bacterium]|nr:DUF4373 domain-containing protein [Eubacteriales bacterium]
MARASGAGLLYFPLDCVLDDKFDLIEAEFGLKGFAVVVKLYQRIYGQDGYYCEWNDDIGMLFSKTINEDRTLVSDIVNRAVDRGLFSEEKLRKYQILTSRGIQKQYFESTSRRKNVSVIREYLLVNADQIPESVNIIGLNVDISAQSKGKESKVKEIKVKQKREEEDPKLLLENTNCIQHYQNNINPVMTNRELEILLKLRKMGAEDGMIVLAIDEAIENNARNIKYIAKIVGSCLSEGCTTADQFRARQAIWEQKKKYEEKRQGTSNVANFSQREYDAEFYEQFDRSLDLLKDEDQG